MSATFKDYYATLGVGREATAAEIKKAFRKLARKHHPDTATEKKGAEEKFKEINEAYEVLGDPEKRVKYDRLGAGWDGSPGFGAPHDWQSTGPVPQSGAACEFHFGGTGFSDFFERYFGGGDGGGFSADFEQPSGRKTSPRPARGNDIEGDILVTLEEAMQGTVRPVSLQIRNQGNGHIETRTFQVRIPPGAPDGCRIRAPGQGEPGRGNGPAGDLFLRVRHAAHPDFTTDGPDLYHELDIAPWDAVLGTEVRVPSLDGVIKLRVPAGAENRQNLRVRGRGLPKGKPAPGGSRGDFFVTLNVVMPTRINDAERKLWQQLRELSRNVRDTAS
jgi:curved DNA-binding protein